MDTNNDIELYDLETIEENLCMDESRKREPEEDAPHASATAFMIP